MRGEGQHAQVPTIACCPADIAFDPNAYRCEWWVHSAAAPDRIGMRALYWTVVVKRELSSKARLLTYQLIYVPTLTYGHELWVVTERIRSRIQAAETIFLRRVSGLSLIDRVGSSDIRRKFGVEPLLLHVERSQMRWFGHLIRILGTFHWRFSGHVQLTRLHISSGSGTPLDPTGDAERRCWGEECLDYLAQPSANNKWQKKDGWIFIHFFLIFLSYIFMCWVFTLYPITDRKNTHLKILLVAVLELSITSHDLHQQ